MCGGGRDGDRLGLTRRARGGECDSSPDLFKEEEEKEESLPDLLEEESVIALLIVNTIIKQDSDTFYFSVN